MVVGATGHEPVAVLQPQTPPDTPTSQNPTPWAARVSPCRTESWKFEFPPSMTTSPSPRRSARAANVLSVGSPDGTMTQTTRGLDSRPTSSSRLSTSESSLWLSYPTTSWPARSSRCAIEPPIRPSPTMPTCTRLSRPRSVVPRGRGCPVWRGSPLVGVARPVRHPRYRLRTTGISRYWWSGPSPTGVISVGLRPGLKASRACSLPSAPSPSVR